MSSRVVEEEISACMYVDVDQSEMNRKQSEGTEGDREGEREKDIDGICL